MERINELVHPSQDDVVVEPPPTYLSDDPIERAKQEEEMERQERFARDQPRGDIAEHRGRHQRDDAVVILVNRGEDLLVVPLEDLGRKHVTHERVEDGEVERAPNRPFQLQTDLQRSSTSTKNILKILDLG